MEAAHFGTKQGMARAVASTGGVITSAGIVLAAVFAALGVLPLVTLGQLPAVFALVGEKIWWPSKPPMLYRRAMDNREAVDHSADVELASDLQPV